MLAVDAPLRSLEVINRAGPGFVALETTLPLHGVPRDRARGLITALEQAVQGAGVQAAFVGLLSGRGVVGLTRAELETLLDSAGVAKVNTSNLGAAAFRGVHGATTVATTVELASSAGVRVAATGGIGGLHRDYGRRVDVSADLAALARYPVAVVSSGVKSLLDVEGTREILESLGVPVVGFRTDRLPAFYLRESDASVDVRFDDAHELARFVDLELCRTGRGILIAQPVPSEAAIAPADWERWLKAASSGGTATARDATPAILEAVHRESGGRTVESNIALAVSNAALAGAICAAMSPSAPRSSPSMRK